MAERRFLLVDADVLPEVFVKVLQAKELLASGAVSNISAAATQAAASLPSRLRNFRRAGVLKNRSSTSTVVPAGQPTSVSLLCPSQISKR